MPKSPETKSPETQSETAEPALISAEDLTLAYGKNVVIRAANFTVYERDFTCIVGANGSGKSTLVKALLGLIQPASGKVVLAKNLNRTTIGFLPQDTRVDQTFPATVLEIVLSGTLGRLKNRVFYAKNDKNRALEALKKLGIEDLKNASFADLSGGQKQKVLLARALTATSKILILDEPSNNLDHKSREDFYKTLKSLNKSGLTILMITHDLDADDLIGNKIISLKEGNVTCELTSDYLRRYK